MVTQPVHIYFLRKHPQVVFDGSSERITTQSLSLLMYVADSGDSEFSREELARLLYGSNEAREKLRKEALYRLPERLRETVLGTDQRDVIQFFGDQVWVDSREFAQQAAELLQESSTFKKNDYLTAKEVLLLYHDAFGLGFNPASAKEANNHNFLKWKQKRQQKLADVYHALLDRMILYCLRHKQRWPEAEVYAEKWLRSINPGGMPLQYLIWLAANQQNPLLDSYLEQLRDYEDSANILGGLSSEQWTALLKKRRPLSLNIFSPEPNIETNEPAIPAETRLLGHEDTVEEILDVFLSSSEASVFAVTGLPGVGKTQIARTAAQALREKNEAYRVIELELMPEVNLELLCNTILGELHQQEALALNYAAKRRRLKQLMHAPNLFIIVDDGHTNAFADSTMLQTILELLEGARVMVVSRELPQFDRYLIEVRGLSWEHTKAFFIERIPWLNHLTDAQYQDIVALTGGLPLILQIIAGFMKKELSRTTSLIDRLKLFGADTDFKANASLAYGEILDWLFQYMDAKERDVLYAISLFSPIEGAAYEDIAAIFSKAGYTAEKVKWKLNRLTELHLVELKQTGTSTVRYRLHPIIFEFVRRNLQGGRRLYFPIIERAYITTLLAYIDTFYEQPSRLDEHQQNIIRMLEIVFFDEAHAWACPHALEAMNKIYPYLEKCGLYVLASKLFNRACELGQFDSRSTHIQTVYHAGKLEYLQLNLEQAMSRFDEALSLAQTSQAVDVDHLGNIYYSVGLVHLRKSEFEAGARNLETAEAWAIHNNQTLLLYSIWSNMGNSVYRQGQFEMAQKYYFRVLKNIGDNALNLSTDLQLVAQYVHMSLGAIYNDLGNPNQAKFHLEQSLTLARQINYPERLGYVYLNLGVTYYQLKDYDAAHNCFVQGEIIADRIHYVELQTQLRWNQAALASTRFQHKEALHLFRSALILADNYDLQWLKPRIMVGLGRAYLRMENFVSALECFTQALALPQALLRHLAQSLYGVGLSVMLKKFLIGNQNVGITLEQLTPTLDSIQLPQLPDSEKFFLELQQAELTFQQQLDHLPELARYRLVDALKIWLSNRGI